jgi:transposase-like protein
VNGLLKIVNSIKFVNANRILKASERWTHPVQNWNLTLSQMAIHFPGRLEHHISL